MSAEELARVKLITLLNVASGRNGIKRKNGEDWHEIAREAKKSKPKTVTTAGSKQKQDESAQDIISNGVAVAEDNEPDEQGREAFDQAAASSVAQFNLLDIARR